MNSITGPGAVVLAVVTATVAVLVLGLAGFGLAIVLVILGYLARRDPLAGMPTHMREESDRRRGMGSGCGRI